MPNPLAAAGAQSARQTRFAALWTARWATGLWTQRSPLRDAASTRIEEKFYGPRGDAFIDGANIELSNRLTPVRRPGNSVYNTGFSAVDGFYEFRLFSSTDEQIRVMVDQADGLYDGTAGHAPSKVWTKSAGAGQTFMQNVANCLFFGNGVDQKKWQQTLLTWGAIKSVPLNGTQSFLIDPHGNIQQLTAAAVPINYTSCTSNVLTVYSPQIISSVVSVGQQVKLYNLGAAAYLNLKTVTITSVGADSFAATLPDGVTHANYAMTAENGRGIVVQGGNPITGSFVPTWSTLLLGKTYDGTAEWTNRGNPLQNWGIAAPTVAPTVVPGGQNDSWQPNTFYAIDPVVVDGNGNLQKVTTAGTSGSSAPAWATSVGATTTDGTAVWTMLQTASSLQWQPHTSYPAGHFLLGTANNISCLLKSTTASAITIKGAVNAALWNSPHSGAVGTVILTYPTTGALATASGNSLLFNPPGHSSQPVAWATLDGAGEITGYTIPFPGYSTNYCIVLTATLTVPAPGPYTFSITHEDGVLWGMGGGAALVSGSVSNPNGQTATPVNNYPLFGSTNKSGVNTDTSVINFPAAGDYPIEIAWDYWYHSGQTFQLKVNGNDVIPQPGESGTTAPIWPNWNTSYAPGYPTVSEAEGALVWSNLGPASDYAWRAKTQYLTDTTIIDANNNTQAPYEAGVSGTVQPTFSTLYNALTSDNPNLTWINQGPAPAAPTGTLSASNGGFLYYVALVNTLDDTVSNVGPASAITGNFRGAAGVQIPAGSGIPASYDPQADYVAIFRTDDGGSTPYLIPGTGNTVYTVPIGQYMSSGFLDTTPAQGGLNILLQAPMALQNTPPKTGLVNLTYHLQRVFGSVGNTVYWSAGPDTPIGNGSNGFPPLNYATFPSLVKKMVPTAVGLVIFTVSDIYLITGQGTSNDPLFPVPYVSGIGLLSANALAVNGGTIYLFTADRQLISLDPHAGVSQVGFPIGDQFEAANWDPAKTYLAWHVDGSSDQALYIADGQTGWFRLCPTPAPEAGMMWSPFAFIQGGCKAVQSVEIQPGVHKLLLGPTGAGPVLKRDKTVWTDNGTTYTAYGTIGSLVLAHPGQIAELSFLTTDASRIGSAPSISVRLDEVFGGFEAMPVGVADPAQLTPSLSLYMQRWYFSQTRQPALCRHLQVMFAWPAENAGNELLSLTLFGGFAQES